MTQPAPQGTTGAYQLTPAASPLRITDGGNSPAGLLLVNRGDHGGTIWVQAGPSGGAGAVPIGPAGSIPWTDPVTPPYAYLSSAASQPETLIVTNQMSGYSNPVAVAAATAAELAVAGIPTVYTDTPVGQWTLAPDVKGIAAPGTITDYIDVSKFSSIIVSVDYSAGVYVPGASTKEGSAVTMTFEDRASPGMPVTLVHSGIETSFDPANASLMTADRRTAHQVPVYGPQMTLYNVSTNTIYASVSVIGTNRITPGFRQMGDEVGARYLVAQSCPAAQNLYLCQPAGEGDQVDPFASTWTHLNGAVSLQWNLFGSTGYLWAHWVDQRGQVIRTRQRIDTPSGTVTWGHPTVPVSWWYMPDYAATDSHTTSATGGLAITTFRLAVLQQ